MNHIIKLFMICITSRCIAYDEPIRHLKPPRLAQHNLGQQIVCHRPMRRGTPRMELEQRNNHIIVHNYGHGGSGWTLAPGCAQFAVNMLTTYLHAYAPEHLYSSPIVIVGAGVIGLFTAYELIRQGYTTVTIIADQYEDLASHNAGGFLAPSTMELTDEMRSCIETICFDAYRFYAAVALGMMTDFPVQGATIIPIYLKRYDTRLAAYENIVMHPPQEVIVDFGNGKRYPMKVYDDGIFIDTHSMLHALTSYLTHHGVQFLQQRIHNLDELDAEIICNCTGLGAGDLVHDDAMVSVQGHLQLLTNQHPEDMNYIISFYTDEGTTDEDNVPVKRSIYMFPKRASGSQPHDIGIMGGTFIEHATAKTPHLQEFERMIERAIEFFGEA